MRHHVEQNQVPALLFLMLSLQRCCCCNPDRGVLLNLLISEYAILVNSDMANLLAD